MSSLLAQWWSIYCCYCCCYCELFNRSCSRQQAGCICLCAGIQLRKVEEHRQQSERKKQTFGKPDVQTIMEAAFEQRRRAIEENDSDRDDDDDGDGDWDEWCWWVMELSCCWHCCSCIFRLLALTGVTVCHIYCVFIIQFTFGLAVEIKPWCCDLFVL